MLGNETKFEALGPELASQPNDAVQFVSVCVRPVFSKHNSMAVFQAFSRQCEGSNFYKSSAYVDDVECVFREHGTCCYLLESACINV